MHQKENMGLVELATVSFGQSFQVTPVQLAATVSSLINGGRRVTPHFGIQVRKRDGTLLKVLEYPQGERILSEETSETVRGILKEVVSEGSGKNAAIEGYSIGGKTATSETIPRSAHRYISSFLGLLLQKIQPYWGSVSFTMQDGDFGKAAAQKRKIYCFVSILCAGGKSAGDGTGAD